MWYCLCPCFNQASVWDCSALIFEYPLIGAPTCPLVLRAAALFHRDIFCTDYTALSAVSINLCPKHQKKNKPTVLHYPPQNSTTVHISMPGTRFLQNVLPLIAVCSLQLLWNINFLKVPTNCKSNTRLHNWLHDWKTIEWCKHIIIGNV